MARTFILLVTCLALLAGCAAPQSDVAKRPQRVLIVVFDQMRPEYAERFAMKNVLAMQSSGVHFPNGYLGHLASETVVSVVAAYWREGGRFRLAAAPGGAAARFGDAELAWWNKHGQALVDTMAAENGPDVIALLGDDVGYGVYGDHGGAKEADQRIPMVVWAANILPAKPPYAFRTVDILPTVLEAMGIVQTARSDGKPWRMEFR